MDRLLEPYDSVKTGAFELLSIGLLLVVCVICGENEDKSMDWSWKDRNRIRIKTKDVLKAKTRGGDQVFEPG